MWIRHVASCFRITTKHWRSTTNLWRAKGWFFFVFILVETIKAIWINSVAHTLSNTLSDATSTSRSGCVNSCNQWIRPTWNNISKFLRIINSTKHRRTNFYFNWLHLRNHITISWLVQLDSVDSYAFSRFVRLISWFIFVHFYLLVKFKIKFKFD